MRGRTPFWRRPRKRFLPLDAYPPQMGEEERDRVDERLKAMQPQIPAKPGQYADNENDPWTLNADGSWTDKHGDTRSGTALRILPAFGPFRRIP